MSDEIFAAIDKLAPTLRERADETEELRRVPAASIEALTAAGFFRMLQPRRHGGLEADPPSFFEAVRRIAAACGSTGWVASILGVHPWHVALFDERAQREVWAPDPDARVCSSYAPMGRAEEVDGGYRLSGRWSYSSGSDHCTWALLGAPVFRSGEQVDFRSFLLPLGDYEVLDVWNSVGLSGSGSNDLLVTEVFVPEHRTLSHAAMARCVVPGQSVNPGALYRMPFGVMHPTAIAAPIVGMAQGAYDAHLVTQRVRVRAVYGGESPTQDRFAMVRIAEASAEIDAAWGQLRANLTEVWACARRDVSVPQELRVRVRRDQVRAPQRAVFAVNRLFENSGARALDLGTPIQRFWRDVHAGRVHAVNDAERAYLLYGKHEFGLPVQLM